MLFPVNGNLPARRPVRQDCLRHQVVGANRPGFPAPTIPRLFSALARKLMVCGVYSAGTTGLGRRTRKWVSDAEFWVPDCGAGLISEIAKGSDCNQRSAGALSPNADHWSRHAIGRSIRRLTPKPRGSRPSIAALTRVGQRKASEIVRRIQRSVLPSRANVAPRASQRGKCRPASRSNHDAAVRYGGRANRW
jgi:hypothetical protein